MVFKEGIEDFFDQLAWLGDYHPYRGGRNPNFNVFSGKVLDLKDGKEIGIEHFRAALEEIVLPGVTVAVVPSHDPANTTGGLRTMAQRLAGACRIDATGCLVRTKKIDKLATGGDRSVEVHLGSIQIRDARLIKGKDVLLLDDVTTSGNSLEACRRLLMDAGAARVQRLAIGKTVA